MAELDGRHVVVTGGTGALGSAVVAGAVALGATVHVPAYDAAEAERFDLRADPRVRLTVGVDLTDEAAVSAFYAALPGLWASLNVAGGFSMAPLTETTANAFRAQLEMNAVSCFLSCREAARAMRRAGEAGGRIVNVAARPALTPTGGMVAYTTAKAAVVWLTTCLAEELRQDGILVNAVAPSVMDTPANRAAMPDADHARWPATADVAAAMLHLALPEMRLTTGLVVPVYGDA